MTSKLRDLRFTGRAPSFIATPSESLPSPNDDNQHLHLEVLLLRYLIAKVSPSELFSQLSDGPNEIQRVGWEASRLICQAHSPAELTHSRTLAFTHSSSFFDRHYRHNYPTSPWLNLSSRCRCRCRLARSLHHSTPPHPPRRSRASPSHRRNEFEPTVPRPSPSRRTQLPPTLPVQVL